MATYRCSICGRKGHNARTCPQKSKKKKTPVRRSKRRCSYCDGTGHNVRTCPEKTKKKKKKAKKKTTKKTTKKSKTVRCEICGGVCVVKLSRWGNEFWGCQAWPRCRGRCPKDEIPKRTQVSTGARDLQAIFDKMNDEYFEGRMVSRIRWSRRIMTSRWGYYDPRARRITINIVLRDDGCPYECLETTVYHEMLHEDIPVYRNPNTGCRVIHGPEFKQREALHPDYQFAKQWLKANGSRVLRGEPSTSEVATRRPKRKKTTRLITIPTQSSGQTFQGLRAGQKFTFRGTTYTITSFHPRRWKYPISASGPRGGRWKFTVEQVKGGMRHNPNVCYDDYDRPGFQYDVFVENPDSYPVCYDDYDRPGLRNDVIIDPDTEDY